MFCILSTERSRLWLAHKERCTSKADLSVLQALLDLKHKLFTFSKVAEPDIMTFKGTESFVLLIGTFLNVMLTDTWGKIVQNYLIYRNGTKVNGV